MPLARAGLDAKRAGKHVVSTSWVALALVAGAAGVFAVAGGDLVEAVLGGAYGDDVGAELGRLVVYLAPWMVASVGVSVTFPLLFVSGRTRGLPLLAVCVIALHVLLAWLGERAFGLAGVAGALAASTALVLVGLLVLLGPAALARASAGLVSAAALVGAVAVAAFAPPALVLPAVAAAAVGGGVYAAALAALRPRGLRDAWAYVRALH